MSEEPRSTDPQAPGPSSDEEPAHAGTSCPIPETEDAFAEAHHFLHQMLFQYHRPDIFRWSLNAFLQALRNVTFRLQSELKHKEGGFEDWYMKQQDIMRSDQLLHAFVEGRNIVCKRRNLLVRSRASIGCFRGRKLKGAISINIDPSMPSEYVLLEFAPKLKLVPEDHLFIGEEYGVERDWIATELGDENVVVLCNRAWCRIGTVVAAAHEFMECPWEPPPEHVHNPEPVKLLTETDLDPSLPEKWGW